MVTNTRATGSGLDSVPVACFVLLVSNTRATGSGLDSVPVACFVWLVKGNNIQRKKTINTKAACSGLVSVPVGCFVLLVTNTRATGSGVRLCPGRMFCFVG